MKRPTLNRLEGHAPSRQNPEKFSDNADRMMTYLAGMPDDLDGMIDYNEGLLEKIEEHEVSSAASKVSAASSAEKVAETEKDIIQREANVEQKAQEAAASAKTAGQLAQAVGANVDAATSAQRASDKALAAAASETKAAASAKEAQTHSKGLADHTGRTDNPHTVTAAQVGALPLSGGTLTGDLRVAGSVTIPNQPSFRATRSLWAWAVESGATIVLDQASHNVGGHYNTSNGRWTVPVAGTYLIHFQSIFFGAYTNESVRIQVNGARINGGDLHFSAGVSGKWNNISNTQILQLEAGDYVT